VTVPVGVTPAFAAVEAAEPWTRWYWRARHLGQIRGARLLDPPCRRFGCARACVTDG